MANNSQAKLDAVTRYEEKTYKRVFVALRLDEDADILESLQEAKEHGYTGREWVRQLFESKGE